LPVSARGCRLAQSGSSGAAEIETRAADPPAAAVETRERTRLRHTAAARSRRHGPWVLLGARSSLLSGRAAPTAVDPSATAALRSSRNASVDRRVWDRGSAVGGFWRLPLHAWRPVRPQWRPLLVGAVPVTGLFIVLIPNGPPRHAFPDSRRCLLPSSRHETLNEFAGRFGAVTLGQRISAARPVPRSG